jgi:NOL1/NOP2/sun family putative RNA methylase
MLPNQFLASIQHTKGFDASKFISVHEAEEQVTSVRTNPFKNNSTKNIEDLLAGNIPWCEHGYYLSERPSFTFDPSFHAGAYYVQEASSMFVWQIMQQLFGEHTNKKVLDVCAAPGGKSTLLASYFINGLVVSNEVIKSRAAILVENITKWGMPNVVVTNNDPKDFTALNNFFDAIVIDAPCSGSGMFRKDADAANEWSLNNVALCSQRQQRIVADVLPALQTDGFLVYSTCSYSKEENEDVLDWIIATFNLTSVPLNIDSTWGIVETESDIAHAKGYRFYPYNLKGEGLFIAVLQKATAEKEVKLKQQSLLLPSKQEVDILQSFLPVQPAFSLFKHATQIRLLDHSFLNDLKTLANYLYIKKAGLCIGEVKGKDLVPHHELAVSTLNLSNIASVSFTNEQALQYLRKQELVIDTTVKGWVLATLNGLGLGWLKVLPNRYNNYYPQEWRILKD